MRKKLSHKHNMEPTKTSQIKKEEEKRVKFIIPIQKCMSHVLITQFMEGVVGRDKT